MPYVRAVFRAAAQIVIFCLGLWGLRVTFDLTALIIVASIIGAVNFGIAVYDERQKEVARQESSEGRQRLQQLQEYVMKLVPPAEVPPHLQNLSRVSNADLKALVHSTTQRLRDFADESGEGKYGPPIWDKYPGYMSLPQAEKNAIWHGENRKTSEKMDQTTNQYLRDYRPDVLSLWEELLKRVPVREEARKANNLIETGMLAGYHPLDTIATELEIAARQLPD